MSPAWTLLLAWLTLSGLFGFTLMGLDKARARDRSWRIPELDFFVLAIMGGAFGILFGGVVFHHKTLKASFMGVIMVSTVLWLGVLFAFLKAFGLPSS